MISVWLFVNKDGTEQICSGDKPLRWGHTKVLNYQPTLDNPSYHKYVNVFKQNEKYVEVDGTLGLNRLWDSGDDWELQHFEIKLEDCIRWNKGLDLPKGSIQKLIGRSLTWEDEPVLYEG